MDLLFKVSGVKIFNVTGNYNPMIIEDPSQITKTVELDALDWYNTYGAWYHNPYAQETVSNIKCFRYYYYNNGTSSATTSRSCFKFPSDCSIPLYLGLVWGHMDIGQTIQAATSESYATPLINMPYEQFLLFTWSDSYSSSGATRTITGSAKDYIYYFRTGVRYSCSSSNNLGSVLASDTTGKYNTFAQAKLFNGFYVGCSSYHSRLGDGYIAKIKLIYI